MSALIRHVKGAVKAAVWSATTHRPGQKADIHLFSSRRGGSTWIMEVIAANRGVRFIDQPFSAWSALPAHLKHLPAMEGSQFIHLSPAEEARVRAFLDGLHEGRIVVNAPWEFWSPTFNRVTDRLLLKILDAKPLIDWLAQTCTPQVVYHTRHPIPTALSVIRNGWGLTAEAYLNSEHFVETWLTREQHTRARRTLSGGSLLTQHVVNWALENLIPLRLLRERPEWLHVSYEETVLHPGETVALLCDRLELADRDRMEAMIERPSRSTRRLASTIGDEGSGEEQLRRWRAHVSEEEERAALGILEDLGIDLYRAGSDLPTRWRYAIA